jgi:hypothetical protein
MATKGTKYSDVNFSVPEGADPLGIGVPDLGRSSYDPIETIRSGWEASRQERLIKGDRDQATYQAYMKNMPTVEGINKQISSKLNREMVEMSGLFKQQQEAGGFGGFAKTATGEKATARLSELENKIATDVPIYKHYSDQYKKDLAVIRSGANKDKIDWELTNANVESMQTAKNVEEFAQPFANNAGSLVVFRPESQDIIGYAKKVGAMIEGTDIMSHEINVDPRTNTMTTTQVKGADPEIIHKAYQTGYEFAEPNMKNAIDSLYKSAPDKKNADGVVMDAKEWFANKFSGLHGTTTTKKTTRLPKADVDKGAGFGYGVMRREDGSINLDSLSNSMVMATPQTIETTKVKRTTLRGKKVYEDEPETATTQPEMQYNTLSIPLSGFDEPFEMYMHGESIDTSTGKAPPLGKSAVHKAVRVDFIPTWRGNEPLDVVIDEVGPDGEIIKTSYSVKPGERMPIEVEQKAIEMGVQHEYTHEPYLMTSSVYGASIQDKEITEGLSWSQYVSRHGKTTIAPWSKVKRELLSKMDSEKYSPEEVDALIQEIYNQKNNVKGVF